MTAYAIVLAAGSGSRVGAQKNKVLLSLAGKPVLQRALESVWASGCFAGVVIAVRPEEREEAMRLAAASLPAGSFQVVEGGERRQDSVQNGLAAVPADAEIIAVHDGARCLARPEVFRACVQSAAERGSGVAGRFVVDTVKRVRGDRVFATIDRSEVVLIQTPQVFEAGLLRQAYAQAAQDGFYGTDECMLVERLGEYPCVIEAEGENLKLTHARDFALAGRLLGEDMRVGHGYDVHAFAPGRRLVLGGVQVPCDRGLAGHSDADVLTHAAMDALLGAAALPDIGQCFPDTDAAYAGADSVALLQKVGGMLSERGWRVANLDTTLVMQTPKIARYKRAMCENFAAALGVRPDVINVKGTTTEGLGFVGRGEGAAAYAVCLLVREAAEM